MCVNCSQFHQLPAIISDAIEDQIKIDQPDQSDNNLFTSNISDKYETFYRSSTRYVIH